MRCECEEQMEKVFEDSRSEWYEETFSCSACGHTKTRRTDYDQNGDIIGQEWI
jgi:hypothetical protein